MSLDIKSLFVSFRNFLTGSLIWLLVLGGACILLIDESALIASMSGKSNSAAMNTTPTTVVDAGFLPVAVEESQTVNSEVALQSQPETAATSPQTTVQNETEDLVSKAVVNVEEVNLSSVQPEMELVPKSTEPVQTAALTPQATVDTTPSATELAKGDWYIQVGVFSSKENAEQMRARAKINGWDVSVHTAIDGTRLITKLFVGPYSSKNAANSVVGEIGQDLNLSDLYVTRTNL